MNTTFQLVSKMNEAFKNPRGNPLNINWPRVQKQCLNIPDETGELFAALGGHPKGSDGALFIAAAVAQFKKDLIASLEMDSFEAIDVIGVRDALCDIPVFATGAQHLMGVDGDRDMESVITGVMSRFVKNEADLLATVERHASKGVTQVYFEGEFPNMVMKSAVDQPDAPKDKFLKSASFVEAEFYDLSAPAPARIALEDVTANGSQGLTALNTYLHGQVWNGGSYDIKSVSSEVNAQASDGAPTQMTFVVTGNNHVEIDAAEEADWDNPDREVGGDLIDTDQGDEHGEECDDCGLDDDCECVEAAGEPPEDGWEEGEGICQKCARFAHECSGHDEAGAA